MATKKIDATAPLYAVVGVTDLAVERARHYSADIQARFAKLDLEPKALRDQVQTVVTARIDELNEDAKGARTTVEARATKARAQLESYVNDTVAEVTETYGDLAARGRNLVARIRRQQATQDAKASAQTAVAKAKTTRTQTTKSAKATAGTTKRAAKTTKTAAKKTAGTAKRNVKATTTSAQKTASAATKAAGDAAEKVGD